MVSALHIDLKLWNAANILAQPHVANDAMGNAWKVARPQRTPDPVSDHPHVRQQVERWVKSLPVLEPQPCVLEEYDLWVLGVIGAIRNLGRLVSEAGPAGDPSMLSTVGMAQKVVNIYWKYQTCWNAGGIWDSAVGAHRPHPNILGFALCAFHCPIDSVLLKAIRDDLALGRWLRERGLMDDRAYLWQAEGNFSPWSKWDCIRSYYGFQLMLRRVAMHTWPKGCACLGQDGRAGVLGVLPPKAKGSGGVAALDWIEEASNLPKEVIVETARQLERNSPPPPPPPPPPECIMVKKQRVFKSLKWNCEDHFNAGALSFDNTRFEGRCYVNSVSHHGGGDEALWLRISDNGHNFEAPGFTPSPNGAVAGVGGGVGYLGYRTFANEAAAREYLISVGVPPADCPEERAPLPPDVHPVSPPPSPPSPPPNPGAGVKVRKQQTFKSLKWNCGDHFNAGALSFDNTRFAGRCYVNSVENHKAGDQALWQRIRDNGFDFRAQPGFTRSPNGAVAGVGGGVGFLGYRTFASEAEAREYLRSVGVPPTDCSP